MAAASSHPGVTCFVSASVLDQDQDLPELFSQAGELLVPYACESKIKEAYGSGTGMGG